MSDLEDLQMFSKKQLLEELISREPDDHVQSLIDQKFAEAERAYRQAWGGVHKEKRLRKLEIGQHRFTETYVMDEPGDGGACHRYHVSRKSNYPQDACLGENRFCSIKFQKGPVKENGVNGCFQEDLIAIVIDRLQCFQAGDFACRENALALTKLEEALHWLNHRTNDRQARGVEGKSEK